MEIYSVFVKNEWQLYTPSQRLRADPRITRHYLHIAAAAYVSAKNKGYSEEKANSLAEAIVFKHLYNELQYTKDFEAEIQSLYV